MSPQKILESQLEKRVPPPLQYVGYQQAKRDYIWLVVRDTLTAIGFSPQDASKLAASVHGSPRERIDRLVQQKRVLL